MPDAEPYDVAIIGGGINGCGTFRDLSLQGLRVLLLERGDFCSGASAASSRLMHGGLKYLETGEFRLLRESLVERNMLLAIAPHHLQPLESVMPVKSVWGGVVGSAARFLGIKASLSDRGHAIMAVGLTLCDLYGQALRSMPTHQLLGKRRLRRLLPDMACGVTGAGIYHEGHITRAERLGLELALDGEAANPAGRAENHAGVLQVSEGVLIWRSARSGVRRARARVIVTAGGAWTDRVNAIPGLPRQLMGGSCG
jgi:glycerol-3-phosphate dehydrogenase